MPGMQMTAGYLVLHNNSDEDIAIDRVASPQFGKVEMHETVIEDGIAKMSALAEIVEAEGFEIVGRKLHFFGVMERLVLRRRESAPG